MKKSPSSGHHIDAIDNAVHRLRGHAAILERLADMTAKHEGEVTPTHDGEFWYGIRDLTDRMYAELQVINNATEELS